MSPSAGVTEPVLHADRPVVDPHHHLWNRGGQCYDLETFESEIRSAHPVLASLYVECLNHYQADGDEALRCLGETRWLVDELDRGQAEGRTPVCRGLIARADLRLGTALPPVLEGHRQLAGERLRGFRFCAAWDASTDVRSHYPSARDTFELPAVSDGLAAVARTGLPLDLWVYFHQLPAVERWLRAHEATPVVLNHCGGPIGLGPYAGRRAEVFDRWAQNLRTLADLPQLSLKFGGLAMPLAGFGWHKQSPPPDSLTLATAWQPYFRVALQAFGPDRVMFESNFPVDRAGVSQVTLWNAFKRLCDGLPQADVDALLSKTARKVYDLH